MSVKAAAAAAASQGKAVSPGLYGPRVGPGAQPRSPTMRKGTELSHSRHSSSDSTKKGHRRSASADTASSAGSGSKKKFREDLRTMKPVIILNDATPTSTSSGESFQSKSRGSVELARNKSLPPSSGVARRAKSLTKSAHRYKSPSPSRVGIQEINIPDRSMQRQQQQQTRSSEASAPIKLEPFRSSSRVRMDVTITEEEE